MLRVDAHNSSTVMAAFLLVTLIIVIVDGEYIKYMKDSNSHNV